MINFFIKTKVNLLVYIQTTKYKWKLRHFTKFYMRDYFIFPE